MSSPSIDFRYISFELVAFAKDADLIILEGMGSIYSYFLEVCRGEKHNVSQKN
jgi:hypothetical protein